MESTDALRRVPPLGWAALALLAQKGLNGGQPANRTSAAMAGATAGASLGLLAWAVISFHRNQTTVDPFTPERATRLVSDGPFRLTRNPMYVAMAGMLLANAMARRSVLGCLAATGFVVVIDHGQIEGEERVMAQKFGPHWDHYAATTPRWVSLRSLAARKAPPGAGLAAEASGGASGRRPIGERSATDRGRSG